MGTGVGLVTGNCVGPLDVLGLAVVVGVGVGASDGLVGLNVGCVGTEVGRDVGHPLGWDEG